MLDISLGRRKEDDALNSFAHLSEDISSAYPLANEHEPDIPDDTHIFVDKE